jgi:hypothetical protein
LPVFLVVFDAIVECHFDRVATEQKSPWWVGRLDDIDDDAGGARRVARLTSVGGPPQFVHEAEGVAVVGSGLVHRYRRPHPVRAAATREAILKSAIQNFARAGYDGVGVREIACEPASPQ